MEIVITIKIDGEEVKVSTETKSEEKQGETSVRVNGDEFSEYARVFDEGCVGWTIDSECNMMFLKLQQRYANDLLRAKGHLFLNEVYDMLGMPRSKAGQIVGWVYNPENPIGDNYVSFGIYNDRNTDFINGNSNIAYLDFNVDGNIMDLI